MATAALQPGTNRRSELRFKPANATTGGFEEKQNCFQPPTGWREVLKGGLTIGRQSVLGNTRSDTLVEDSDC